MPDGSGLDFHDARVAETLRRPEISAAVEYSELTRLLAEDRPRQLRFLLSRLPTREDAEDALQDAAVRFLLRADALIAAERPQAWMAASLRRMVVDRYRRAGARRRAMELFTAEPVAVSDTPEGGAPGPSQCLVEALEDLKPQWAQILRKTYLEEQPLKVVAAQLGVTSNNAAVRLHRARAALRKSLAGKCGACSLLDCWARQRTTQ